MEDRVTAIEAQLAGKTLQEHFREQAELIDRLFAYRFDELDKKWGPRFGTLERHVGTLRTDVGTLKADVTTLKSDVTTLKADVGFLKGDVSALKKDMVIVREGISILLKRHN